MAEMWDYILYSMNAPFGRTRVTRGWNRTFGFVRSHIFKFVGDGQYGVVPVIKIPHKNGVGTLESDRSLSNRDRQGRRKKAQMSQNVLIE